MEFKVSASTRIHAESFAEAGASADQVRALFQESELFASVDIDIYRLDKWELDQENKNEEGDTDAGV